MASSIEIPLQIVGISVVASLLVEFFNWLFLFRSSKFQQLVTDSEVLQSKLDELEASGKDKDKKKKIEQKLTKVAAAAYGTKLFTMVINFVLLGAAWRMVSKQYAGQEVARLPFQPWALFAKMSHAGLPGKDMYACSANFIYILSQAILRPTMAKFVNASAHKMLNAQGSRVMEQRFGTKQD